MSGPLRQMLRQMPAKGSPTATVARRMLSTRGESGLEREKRPVRAPLGSRVLVMWAVMREMMHPTQPHFPSPARNGTMSPPPIF